MLTVTLSLYMLTVTLSLYMLTVTLIFYMLTVTLSLYHLLTTLSHSATCPLWCMPPSSPPPQGGMVFVCGTIDGLIQISGRRHNTEDLIATVLAVEPHTFVYKGR